MMPKFFFHIVERDHTSGTKRVEICWGTSGAEGARHSARELLADKVCEGALLDGQELRLEG
jgi:hypothetical protein